MNPRLVIIITRAEIGGAQKYVLSMINALKPEFDVHVLVANEGFLTSKLKQIRVNYTIIPSIDSLNAFSAIYSIRKEILRLKPDAINVHSTLASIYARLARFSIKTPVIYSVHGWFFANNTSTMRRLVGPTIERLLSPLTDCWITETEFDRNLGIKLRILKEKEKSFVVPNGIKECKHPKTVALDKELVQVVSVGRVSYQKNLGLAVKIIALLPSNYRLSIYCDDARDEKLLNLITSLNVTEKVKLINSESNTACVLHCYDILLVTSRYEGMPLVILEAMASGLPIVSSNVCGIKEIILDGENGYLIDQFDPKAYAKKILSIFKDRQLLENMSKQSRSYFLENHQENKMMRSLKKILLKQVNQESQS